MTRVNNYDILDKLFRTTEMIEADSEKRKIKKLLTSDCGCGNINKLSRNGSPLDLFLPPHGSGQVIKKKKKGLDKESKVW